MARQTSTAFEKALWQHGEAFVPFDPVIPVFVISTKENNLTEAKRHTQHHSSEPWPNQLNSISIYFTPSTGQAGATGTQKLVKHCI